MDELFASLAAELDMQYSEREAMLLLEIRENASVSHASILAISQRRLAGPSTQSFRATSAFTRYAASIFSCRGVGRRTDGECGGAATAPLSVCLSRCLLLHPGTRCGRHLNRIARRRTDLPLSFVFRLNVAFGIPGRQSMLTIRRRRSLDARRLRSHRTSSRVIVVHVGTIHQCRLSDNDTEVLDSFFLTAEQLCVMSAASKAHHCLRHRRAQSAWPHARRLWRYVNSKHMASVTVSPPPAGQASLPASPRR